MNEIEGFYHDCSLLFDDGCVFIVYGNTQIYITELNDSLTGPKKGGLNKMIIEDGGDIRLGYEGAHLYKMNGKYYLFFKNEAGGALDISAAVSSSLKPLSSLCHVRSSHREALP